MFLDKEQKRQCAVNGGLLRQEGCQSCCYSPKQQRGTRRWQVKQGLLASGEARQGLASTSLEQPESRKLVQSDSSV